MAATKIKIKQLTDGTAGQLITWDASGVPATVATGTTGQILTSNGVGADPTFQTAVDATTASNGLTKTANDIALGGSLTANTTVTTTSTYTLNVATSRAGAANAGFIVTNNSTGSALKGVASGTGTGYGVWGTSADNYAVRGESTGIAAGAFFTIDAGTNTVLNGLIIDRQVSPLSAANGLGVSLDFNLESTTTISQQANTLVSKWTNATHGSLASEFSITGVNGSVAATLLTLAGTGRTTLNKYGGGTFTGTAAYNLQVDSSGNIIETTAGGGGGSGDIINGGNTTGAAVTIGTNDAFDLNLETNNVTRFSITGAASTGGAFTFANVNTLTNTTQDVATFTAATTGAVLANYGLGFLFRGHTSTGVMSDMARTRTYWTTAANGTQEAAYSIMLGDGGGALVEKFKFDCVASGSGVLTIGSASGLAISNSAFTASSAYTLSSSSDLIILSGKATVNCLKLYLSDNAAAAVSSINIGSTVSCLQTSGTRNYVNFDLGFVPPSGTAVHNQFSFTGTLSQTGGTPATGIIRCINIAHTMGAVADYRAIEIADNIANTKGIYQTGALTTNNFVGKTAFGSTTTPSEAINVTGNIIVVGQYAATKFALTDGATIPLDWNLSNVQSVTLAGNRIFTFINPKSGGRYLIFLKQDTTGSRTVTWPTIIWRGGTAPTLTTAANKTDLITLVYDGTSYYGDASLNY